MRENEMVGRQYWLLVGWHHWLDGHEFEQALEVGDGERSLECCSPWGCRVGHDLVIEQQQWF